MGSPTFLIQRTIVPSAIDSPIWGITTSVATGTSRLNVNCGAVRSVRRLAHQTGLSKSSVHRLTQAMERRNCYPESWFWETADGRQWLTRLVIATLYTFGLKRGVGLDTMSEFFTRLHLATQVGCSPSALRRVMQTLEAALLETTGTWEQEGCTSGEVREVIAAVDETFLERMLLVCMDLATGYLLPHIPHPSDGDPRIFPGGTFCTHSTRL